MTKDSMHSTPAAHRPPVRRRWDVRSSNVGRENAEQPHRLPWVELADEAPATPPPPEDGAQPPDAAG